MLKRKGTEKVGSTNVIYVIDHSGSMTSIWDEVLNAVELNLKEVQKSDLENYVSMIVFDDQIDEVMWRVPAKEVVLDRETYFPRGLTSMLDAVGLALSKAHTEYIAAVSQGKLNEAFYLVIVSDGIENNSKEWTYQKIQDKVKTVLATDHFTITYLGSNQDLAELRNLTGINQTYNWNSTLAGTRVMGGASAGATQTYFASRAEGQTVVNSLYEEEKEEEEVDAPA